MMCFQMILSCLNLLRCQVLLEEIMIVISVTHDKSLLVLTDDTIGIKTVIMVFIMMVSMMIFVVLVIMSWIWCCCICPFQVVLRGLNLVCCQILLEEVMIVITVTHDKTLLIFSNNTISVKSVTIFFMFLM